MTLPNPWHFARPDTAEHYLALLADAPRRPLAVYGPRQIGKTHFLTHDLMERARSRGWLPLYTDLWGQADPLGAVNTSLAALLRVLTMRTTRTAVTSVGAVGVSVGLAAPAPLAAPADPAAMLALQFAELLRLEPEHPVLLLLDEAQTLGRPGAGDAAMKAIRALFNAHPGRILLMFTGSSKAQLTTLVGDHSRTAFKLAAHMDFPALGIGFVSFVAARFKAITGRELAVPELDWAFGQLLHRPGELIDFVRYLITEGPAPATAPAGADLRTGLEAFKLKNRPDVSFQQQYDGCTPLQQAVLAAMAQGHKLFARDSRERFARHMRQASAVAPVSVHHALAQLEAKGLIARSEGRGKYLFEDEHLRSWLTQVASAWPPGGKATG
jgi:uncharacterized protein